MLKQATKGMERDETHNLMMERDALLSQQRHLSAVVEELTKQNEALNKTLEELQQQNLELDEVVYRTSHDLKSPISSVLGLALLMKGDSGPAFQYAQHVEKQMLRMSELLRTISTFSQATSDSVSQHEVFIKPLIEEIAGEPQFARRNNTSVQVECDEKVLLLGNRILLGTALKAILSNAFLYCDPRKDNAVNVLVEDHDNRICLYVSDQGDGMPPEVLNRAFEMFYRGSEKSQGSGLGLYMAKRIITRMEGTITLTSECEKGTEVQIVVPKNRTAERKGQLNLTFKTPA